MAEEKKQKREKVYNFEIAKDCYTTIHASSKRRAVRKMQKMLGGY